MRSQGRVSPNSINGVRAKQLVHTGHTAHSTEGRGRGGGQSPVTILNTLQESGIAGVNLEKGGNEKMKGFVFVLSCLF